MTIHDEADKMAMQLRAYEAVTMPGQPFSANTVRPWLENNYRMRSYAADLIRTLSARLREAEARPAVRVKPLVWEEHDGKSYRQANCVLGQYQVAWLGEFECWQLSRPKKAEQEWKEAFSRHSNKDAAKSAAQADYEARILAAVEAVDLRQIMEATHPDFIFGAMDNVNDMDVTLDDFAKAASKAIRAALALIDGENGNG